MAVVSLTGLKHLAQVFPRNRRSLNSPIGGMARKAMHLARKETPRRRARAQDRSQSGSMGSRPENGDRPESTARYRGGFGGFDPGRNFTARPVEMPQLPL